MGASTGPGAWESIGALPGRGHHLSTAASREHCARPGDCCPPTGALSSAPPAAAARGSADGQWAQRRRPAAGTVRRRVSRLRHGPTGDLTRWRRPALSVCAPFLGMPVRAIIHGTTETLASTRYQSHDGFTSFANQRCPCRPAACRKQTAFDPALCMPICIPRVRPAARRMDGSFARTVLRLDVMVCLASSPHVPPSTCIHPIHPPSKPPCRSQISSERLWGPKFPSSRPSPPLLLAPPISGDGLIAPLPALLLWRLGADTIDVRQGCWPAGCSCRISSCVHDRPISRCRTESI